ncbi:Crp/Fnr family transcriptional regulator [Desulfosarcina ovata subsp. sediminis]|uniref:Crp/Fnr family transcriptional regulator n=1 Tax=Desulfosarcina ovata subsp. sediminis TaxID=885957 RepID=A0A5K7ZK76_9BACT|nr:Crp/Fnr family transcriptional regulator [Desulfosarcina ovata]BBO81436.1 Crp/Fnr family transcriptional regulator [Desulfosarcina ovata subsp. sediminis]
MLERVALFSNLEPQQIARLESICLERTVPKNTLVINEGDETDCLYVLLAGKAQALRSDDSGRQFVVNRFAPDDYFGEMSLLDRRTRCATVITKTQCTLLILPRKAFFDFADAHPELYRNVIGTLLDKLRKATQQIEELAFLDVYGRLARLLTESQNADGIIEEKLTQQDLADMVGSSRETVCRIYNELVDGGFVVKDKGRMRIKKKLPFNF